MSNANLTLEILVARSKEMHDKWKEADKAKHEALVQSAYIRAQALVAGWLLKLEVLLSEYSSKVEAACKADGRNYASACTLRSHDKKLRIPSSEFNPPDAAEGIQILKRLFPNTEVTSEGCCGQNGQQITFVIVAF